MNGTTNFMLTKMEGGADYGEVLAEAQALGYAEGELFRMVITDYDEPFLLVRTCDHAHVRVYVHIFMLVYA
jgi:sugar phosphate isomerase/epimerase